MTYTKLNSTAGTATGVFAGLGCLIYAAYVAVFIGFWYLVISCLLKYLHS